MVDTDVVSFLLRGTPLGRRYHQRVLVGRGVAISQVTRHEMLSGALSAFWSATQMRLLLRLLGGFEILPLNEEIERVAATLRERESTEGRTLHHNDSLIAATAMVHGLRIASNNRRHIEPLIDHGLNLVTLSP